MKLFEHICHIKGKFGKWTFLISCGWHGSVPFDSLYLTLFSFIFTCNINPFAFTICYHDNCISTKRT